MRYKVPLSNYYAVAKGRTPGMYTTWAQCQEQTDKLSGECHAGFTALKECATFMKTNDIFNDESCINVYGPRGKKYSLREWTRKHADQVMLRI